jgi:hypothetical protein
MTNTSISERRDSLSTVLEEHHGATAAELNKILEIEGVKRQKVTLEQDELDSTQDLLEKRIARKLELSWLRRRKIDC